MLYPLKFKPRVKERIWGGQAILAKKGKAAGRLSKDKLYGESWDLSSVKGDVSVVANGFLKGNNLEEVIEVYMGELVGEENFERYGLEFPLLIKYLDCNDKLSVQVHPDDALAEERHNSFGKTEAWYVVDCKPGAAIYLGFKDLNLTREEYIAAVSESRLEELLNKVEVKPGDTFFIPAGTVHALGAGLEVVEVQQTSDITYRIYDWDRVDAEGKSRELHTALAVDAIDFEADAELLHRKYDLQRGGEAKVIESNYFTMVLHDVAGAKTFDHSALDSFVVYIALNGSVRLIADGNAESLEEGEVILIPAETSEILVEGDAKLMEVYIAK
ncbi:MAG: class I mannose-6-phosphate isomerase [Alistipes sp.]|nr:class I mannose-6-phosphate isomerase [Alistipes sp.]